MSNITRPLAMYGQDQHAQHVDDAVPEHHPQKQLRRVDAELAGKERLQEHAEQPQADQQPVVAVDPQQAEIEDVTATLDLFDDFGAMGKH
jgi:hypothetical protein